MSYDVNPDRYHENAIQLLKAFIDKNNGLKEGDKCPICEMPFKRELLYLDYTPASKDLKGMGFYILECTGCHIRVRDIWGTKEIWEVVAQP